MVDYLRDENLYRLTQGQISLAEVSQQRFSNHQVRSVANRQIDHVNNRGSKDVKTRLRKPCWDRI